MLLALNHITKKYDNKVVLNNAPFRLEPGVHGLLGSNRSGKTTFFRIICGVINQTAGTVTYNHDDTRNNPDAFRSILGFFPQDFSYYPDFTGMKFMLYITALKLLHNSSHCSAPSLK